MNSQFSSKRNIQTQEKERQNEMFYGATEMKFEQ